MPLIFRFFAVLKMTNITIYTMDSNLIFGIRPVAEAIEAGKQIEKLYIRKGAEGQLMQELKDLCMRHRLHYQEVPVEKLNRLTRGNHQGVVVFSVIKRKRILILYLFLPNHEDTV